MPETDVCDLVVLPSIVLLNFLQPKTDILKSVILSWEILIYFVLVLNSDIKLNSSAYASPVCPT